MNARPGFVAALVIAAVLAPLLAWWLAGSDAMDRHEMRLVAQARGELMMEELRLAAVTAQLIEAVRESEARRPWYHYQDYYNDPAAVAEGAALFPSPLASTAKPPLVAAHVSVASDGSAWQSGWPDFRATDLPRFGDDAERGIGEMQIFPNASYVQNVQANTMGKGMRFQVRAPDIPIEVQSFRWTRLETRAGPALAAVRRVETPDGWRVQAFVIDRAALREWLAQGHRARLVDRGGREGGAPIPVENCPWDIVLTDDSRTAAAMERAALLRSRFWRTFTLGSSLAVLAAIGAAVFITQGARIARQRALFAAAAAHELRTPLASLRLQAELLQADAKDEAAIGRAGRIVRETARVARVVTNILGATRLERGGIAVSTSDGDLAAAVRAIVEEQRSALASRGIEVTLAGADEPLPARFDAEALAHVVGNLLDNADRHGREGGSASVELRLGRKDDRAIVLVRDGGPGVPAGMRATIFEPYARSADPSRGGLGLGLPIARALCRAMGGDLRLLDAVPGATFEISLPAA